MFKRILILVTGVTLGFVLTVGAARLVNAWGLLPNRELTHSTDYLREVLQMVNQNYVDATAATYDKLTKSAIHGMVESLDPHSEYLEKQDNEELDEELSGDFTGIGIQVEMSEGHVRVIAPIANSPGERAGLEHGDELTGVNGRPFEKGITLDTVVDRLRGKPHTKVTVDLFRPRTGRKFRVTIERDTIELASIAAARVLADHTGYIRISDFTDHTGEEFGKALDKLLQAGIDSLILDLRNNPGGSLEAAVDVANPFFRKGEMIVYTRGRNPDDSEDYRAEGDGDPLELPMAVLINAGTASAAEVVTGALKDTGRAVVVGERSFGKGSVQTIFKLKNGEGLKLTTARYFTPSGVSIHEKGIAPQVRVVLTTEDDSKIRVQQTREDMTDPAEFKERFGFTPIPDRQLAVAMDVLQAAKLLDERHAAVAALH